MRLFKAIPSSTSTVWMVLLMLLAPPTFAQTDDGNTASDASVPASKPKMDWKERLREATVMEGQPVLLVVHSAKDCIYCTRWKGSLGGKGEFESWAQTHPDVHLVIVDRQAIASAEVAEDYPDSVQWLFKRNQQRGNLQPGTPLFEIVVAHKTVWRSYGYHSWDRDVFPAIKDLDGRRSASGSAAD